MKLIKSNCIIFAIFLLLSGIIISSCVTTRQEKLAAQRQGLMLMDKSEFTRNKGKWKPRKKAYQMKKYKKWKKKRRR